MIGRTLISMSLLALAVAAAVAPAPASAQCRLCDVPTTSPGSSESDGRPLRLEVVTSLDFDRLILVSAGRGTITVKPDGTSVAAGSLSSFGNRAMAGQVVIRGEPGRAVRVDLPRAIDLYGLKGGSIRIESLTSDLAANPQLDGAGELKIRIGGELVTSGELDGDFRGDVAVMVDYL
jgi:hypothetical protein